MYSSIFTLPFMHQSVRYAATNPIQSTMQGPRFEASYKYIQSTHLEMEKVSQRSHLYSRIGTLYHRKPKDHRNPEEDILKTRGSAH